MAVVEGLAHDRYVIEFQLFCIEILAADKPSRLRQSVALQNC